MLYVYNGIHIYILSSILRKEMDKGFSIFMGKKSDTFLGIPPTELLLNLLDTVISHQAPVLISKFTLEFCSFSKFYKELENKLS